MIVFAQHNIELEYHPPFQVLEVRWMGTLDREVSFLLWRKIVEVATTYVITSLLLDASHVDVSHQQAAFSSQLQDYFTKRLPIKHILHLKKIARISTGYAPYDQDITELFDHLQKQNHSSFCFASFQHHYEAMDWLIEGSYH